MRSDFLYLRFVVALLLPAFLLTIASPPAPVWAMLAPAELAAEPHTALNIREADLKVIEKALESQVLRQRLAKLGLNEQEIQKRLTKLSDEDVHRLASSVETVYPGGDGAGLIVTLLVIGILVLLFVYLLERV